MKRCLVPLRAARLTAGVVAFALQAAVAAPPVQVDVDCRQREGPPLSKSRFGGFNSGMVPLARYQRDLALFDELRPQSLRVDLAWGARWAGWKRPPVAGTLEAPHYDFAEMDGIAALLNAHRVLPYWAYCYMPGPLQREGLSYRSPAVDPAAWGRVLAAFARHHRETAPAGMVGYHEIYNEPDNRDFFRGSPDDYLALYRHGVRAIREADPDAVVGGPSLAFNDGWVKPFLDAVIAGSLPLDFFSFHYYPSTWEGFYPAIPAPAEGSKSVAAVVRAMQGQLSRYPALATTELHLNEFNAYRIDYPRGGSQDRHGLAAELLHAFRELLEFPDLTLVHWAQFMDSAGGNYSGVIDIEGRRKAAFNAWHLYTRLPVDRCRADLRGPEGVEALAAADPHRAGVVLWNRSGAPQEINLNLTHAPFPVGDLQVFRIDANHASHGDQPETETLTPVLERSGLSTATVAWQGALPAGGVVGVELTGGRPPERPFPDPAPRLVRVRYYFPDRGSKAYADFDRESWTVRLGMNGELQARAQVGLVLENLPPALAIGVETEGALRRIDRNSLLGVRMDFHDATSAGSQAVLFHGPGGDGVDVHDPARDVAEPWGTGRPPDRVVRVPELRAFTVKFREVAPPDWNGRVTFTAVLQNAGETARARVRLGSR